MTKGSPAIVVVGVAVAIAVAVAIVHCPSPWARKSSSGAPSESNGGDVSAISIDDGTGDQVGHHHYQSSGLFVGTLVHLLSRNLARLGTCQREPVLLYVSGLVSTVRECERAKGSSGRLFLFYFFGRPVESVRVDDLDHTRAFRWAVFRAGHYKNKARPPPMSKHHLHRTCLLVVACGPSPSRAPARGRAL